MRPGLVGLVVDVLVEHEQLLEFDFLLLAGVDETDLGPDLGGEQFDHVVAQRLRGGDHLALLHEEADDVGGGAVELGTEFLRRGGALDDDHADGDGRLARGVARGVDRLQFVLAATTTALPTLWATRTAGSATGTTTATGTTAGSTTGTTRTTGATAEAATGATSGTTGTPTGNTRTSAGAAGTRTGTARPCTRATGSTGGRDVATNTGGRRDGLAGGGGGRTHAGRGRDGLAGGRHRRTRRCVTAGRRCRRARRQFHRR